MGDFIAWWDQAPVAWIVLGIIGGIVAIGFYFLPTVVARKRKHNNALAIFILNLFMVFTGGIAWIVALVWACTNNTEKKRNKI
ncbi:MAG: superinfection immunity protein [Candidatus Omnitrophica bacterium]|nr:superinfection immunity protein [Candidatus Omnitrophota bacterium]